MPQPDEQIYRLCTFLASKTSYILLVRVIDFMGYKAL